MSQRKFSKYSNPTAEFYVSELLTKKDPQEFANTMKKLGALLGDALCQYIAPKDLNLLVSTAEDADSLSSGVIASLDTHQLQHKLAVFWNNHYQTTYGSVAPITSKYLEAGFESADNIILIKSIISGSCVIKTNLLALIDKVKQSKAIYILAPVKHINSEENLKNEFSSEIANKFKFIYFAEDEVRESDGTVRPGIGGDIYEKLGLAGQPANIGYMPELVKKAIRQALPSSELSQPEVFLTDR
ncbi:Uncharacterised protein [Oligella ureolytica]|uniref:hypothetical protein n=1 Tax=Oligella ureolytica TaxID=90244 RepID=UPI000DF97A93|nr:hypothetical protein [Oligella ureolytica]SUA54069.1 Uncharacterised protein [Oligella ureolytica]